VARLSVELKRYFFDEARSEEVTLAAIWQLAGERIFGFLFVLLSLPSALPVPAPGYSIPFGVVMLLLALQLLAGWKRPWLPQKMLNRPIELSKVQGFLNAGMRWLHRIEMLSRPRLSYVCTSLPGRVVIGCAIAVMSVSMMIPIPFTNTLPAIGIFVIGFGLLDDDGAISLAGLVICAMAFTLSASVLFFGYEMVRATIDLIKDFVLNRSAS
jgi:hypothetical protein